MGSVLYAGFGEPLAALQFPGVYSVVTAITLPIATRDGEFFVVSRSATADDAGASIFVDGGPRRLRPRVGGDHLGARGAAQRNTQHEAAACPVLVCCICGFSYGANAAGSIHRLVRK